MGAAAGAGAGAVAAVVASNLPVRCLLNPSSSPACLFKLKVSALMRLLFLCQWANPPEVQAILPEVTVCCSCRLISNVRISFVQGRKCTPHGMCIDLPNVCHPSSF